MAMKIPAETGPRQQMRSWQTSSCSSKDTKCSNSGWPQPYAAFTLGGNVCRMCPAGSMPSIACTQHIASTCIQSVNSPTGNSGVTSDVDAMYAGCNAGRRRFEKNAS